MGRGIQTIIAGEVFATKKDLTVRVRAIVSKYRFGDFLDAADTDFCMALFKFHTESQRKIGSGVSKIEIRRDEYGKKYMHIHRTDGTDTDISWTHCVASI